MLSSAPSWASAAELRSLTNLHTYFSRTGVFVLTFCTIKWGHILQHALLFPGTGVFILFFHPGGFGISLLYHVQHIDMTGRACMHAYLLYEFGNFSLFFSWHQRLGAAGRAHFPFRPPHLSGLLAWRWMASMHQCMNEWTLVLCTVYKSLGFYFPTTGFFVRLCALCCPCMPFVCFGVFFFGFSRPASPRLA